MTLLKMKLKILKVRLKMRLKILKVMLEMILRTVSSHQMDR
jgi:hypothetical protein